MARPKGLTRRVLRAGVATGVLLVSLVFAAGETPAGQNRSRLVFAGYDGVRTMDAAGGPTQLVVPPIGTQPDQMTFNARWSPDGQWIAYMRGWAIWVVRPDGSDNHAVAGGKSNSPSWSADSRYIYFTRFLYGPDHRIDSVGVDGRPGPSFGNPTGRSESAAEWSPDGTRVTFNSRGEDGTYRLFIMGASGSGLRAITNGETNDVVADWSPDGRKLLMSSLGRHGERVDVVIMDADGGNRRIVRRDAWAQSWSPDGRRILVTDDAGLAVKSMAVDGTGAISLPPMDTPADWGPGTVDPDPTPMSTTKAAPSPSTSVPAPPPVPLPTTAVRATTTGGGPATSTTARSGGSPSAPDPEGGVAASARDSGTAEVPGSASGSASASGLAVDTIAGDASSPTRTPAVAVAGLLLAAVLGLTLRWAPHIHRTGTPG